MMDEYGRALSEIRLLGDLWDGSRLRNEATTRLQVIDRLLMDGLGWQPEDIFSEEHIEGDYRDYSIGRPQRLMVVEAKREGVVFDLPAGLQDQRFISLRSVADYNDTNRRAVQQVMGYCQRSGIEVAVLCNGHQLIAFLAVRLDGIPPLSGKALNFGSPQDMVNDFNILWDSLSKPGLTMSRLRSRLTSRPGLEAPPEKLSRRILNYPGFRSRTTQETDLKLLGDLFLQDLIGEEGISEEFLKECYCPSGALPQYMLVSREILQARYAALRSGTSADLQPINQKGKRKNDDGGLKLKSDVVAAALARRPIILLGDVGVGKTIFIRRLVGIEAADVLTDSVVFYVDFGKEPALADDLRSYIMKRLEQQLASEHDIDISEDGFVRAVYNGDINKFRKGIYKPLYAAGDPAYALKEIEMLASKIDDRASHLKRSLEHLRGTQKREFVFILDNIDQRPSTFQEEVFLIAQSLAETWPGTVFVALRPDTFNESRERGSLAAYQPRVFTVLPPRIDQVISKRLTFARKQLQETRRLDSFPQGLALDSESLTVYIDVLATAYRDNRQLIELMENLSGGNVRRALSFLSTFVGSGYVATRRILEVHRRGGQYIIPLHEFIRAIALGEYEYYDPNSAPVPNLLIGMLVSGQGGTFVVQSSRERK